MNVKLFEVRDRATMIAAYGFPISDSEARNDREGWIVRRCGYGAGRLVMFGRLDGGHADYDPYSQRTRTMSVAHQYVADHWDELESGAVVDVEFIRGERSWPKISEQFR